ncbi:MFS transporter [Mesorhizobium sp. AR10]|uniref:MFS transporter n=1 Tax=Mesorhizobium sp. AR10 TaxID=2865839 RepID=UPI00215EC743|nr:MFS transporter [Mesorhizobium sp. AR10]UVK37304.1 MFS transporter [Mesorhizobium sp. AR10]
MGMPNTMVLKHSPNFLYIATIAATSLGFVVVQLDVSIVNVALNKIGSALSMGIGGLQWVVDAYTLSFASLLLAGGALGDRIGARSVFVGGMVLFSIASLVCGLAQGAWLLIAARAVQGAGAALLMPCSLALLNRAYASDKARRARAVGLWTAAGGIALSAGPVLGGVMVASLGWASIFLVNLPIGALAIWMAYRFLQETPLKDEKPPIDWAGQGLVVLTLFALTGAFIAAGSTGWTSPLVIGGLAVAIVAGSVFLLVESRAKAPMFPLDLFVRRVPAVTSLVGLAVNLALYGTIFMLSLYFQQERHYSPQQTGLAFLPFMAAVTVSNVVAGRIAGKYGARLPMAIGLSIGAAGFGFMALIQADTSYMSLLWRLLFLPIGIGLAVPAMTTALLSSVPTAVSGTASGMLNTVRQSGGAIGVALFGSALALGTIDGMRLAFLASALAVAGAAICAFVFIRDRSFCRWIAMSSEKAARRRPLLMKLRCGSYAVRRPSPCPPVP